MDHPTHLNIPEMVISLTYYVVWMSISLVPLVGAIKILPYNFNICTINHHPCRWSDPDDKVTYLICLHGSAFTMAARPVNALPEGCYKCSNLIEYSTERILNDGDTRIPVPTHIKFQPTFK